MPNYLPLDKSNSLFLHLAESIEDIYWIRNQKELLYVNSAFEKTWGVPGQRLIENPRRLLNMIHPDDLTELAEVLEREKHVESEPQEYRYRIIMSDKAQKWMITKSYPFCDPETNTLYRIGITTDITKQVEKDKQLAESEFRFRQMIENMPTGVAVYQSIDNEADFSYIEFNRASEKQTNTTREAVLASTLLNEFPTVRETPLFEALQKASRHNLTSTIDPFYYLDSTRGGWRKGHVYPLPSGEGAAILQDISEEMETKMALITKNKELEMAKRKAQESDHLKTQFLQNMSHEIRTPLHAITGFTSLLSFGDINSDEFQEYLGIIQKSGDKIVDIISDIITMSKLQLNQVEKTIKPIKIDNLAKNIHLKFLPEAQKKNLKLTLSKSFDEKCATIYSDEYKIMEILDHLVSNALKFTHQGTIEINFFAHGRVINIEVADTGIGVKKENYEKIFNSFTQEQTLSEGTGLGLTISKLMAELLGGSLNFKSQEGEGSSFTLQIPCCMSDNLSKCEYRHDA